LHIWLWVQQDFSSTHFSSYVDVIQFMKAQSSLLVKDICRTTIPYSIWMLWRMDLAIHTIKG